MKIYTYYEDVSFPKQLELINVWKESWEKQGFSTFVLTRDDAKKSPLYQQYYDFIQRVHENVSGKTLPDNNYHLAAQLEIVAFTTIDKDKVSYISDYDVINKNFTFETREEKLHWRDYCCSCFASGNRHGWIKYVNFLLEQEKIIIDWCLKEKEKTQRTEYHDQDFLIATSQIGIEKNIYNMSKSFDLCKMYFPKSKHTDIKLYHLSHNNIGKIIERCNKYNKICNIKEIIVVDYKNNQLQLEEIRLTIAKSILDNN